MKNERSHMPAFPSKKAALNSLWRDLLAPFLIVLNGVFYFSTWRGQLGLTTEETLHVVFVIISVGFAAAMFFSFRAIKTYKFILSKEFEGLPADTVPRVFICARCEEAYPPDVVQARVCERCGGPLEESEGFYERHPQFKKRQEKTEDQGFLKRLKNDLIVVRSQSKFIRPHSRNTHVLREQRAVRGGIPRFIILVFLLLVALAYAIHEIPRAWNEFLK